MPPSTPSHPGRTSSKRRTPTFTKIAKDWAAAPLPVDVLHGLAFQLLPTFVPQLADPSLKPLLDFATTSLSGVLLGMVGPVVGPALALGAGTQAIGNALTGSNPIRRPHSTR